MSEHTSPNGRPADSHGAPTRRQMVRYQFFKVDPSWRGLAPEVQEAGRRALEEAVTAFAGRMLIRAYSTVGTRGDVDFLLWQVSTDMEAFGQLSTAIYSTPMGPYLKTPYAYLAMTRRSIYEIPEESESGTNRSLTIQPGTDKYLFIYPFVKTRAWYALPFDERQAMINQHIVVGRKFPSVKLNTTYSFGLDDQEFVVAFETDEAGDFLDLVMALRETRASEFTLRDVPIFSCVSTSLRGALEALGTNGAWALPSHQSTASLVTTPGLPAHVDAAGWAEVAASDDLARGGRLVVYAHNDQIALFKLEDGLYAISNRCTHARGPLADGRVEGCVVTCPWHDGRFDLATGRAQGAPATVDVLAYDVRVADGRISVRPRVAEAVPA